MAESKDSSEVGGAAGVCCIAPGRERTSKDRARQQGNARAKLRDVLAPETDNPGNLSEAPNTDVFRHLRVVAKRKWSTLAISTATLAAVVAYGATRPKVYEAQVSVIIDPQAPKVLSGMTDVVELGAAGSLANSTYYYNTQFRIIQSRSLSERVVERFNLHTDPRMLGPSAQKLDDRAKIARAAGMLRAAIRVVPVKDSRIVSIGIRDKDPVFAAQLANQLSEVYTEQNVRDRVDVTQGATRWVAEQLDSARKALRDTETALYKFRLEHNILSTSLEDKQNILTTQLQEYSSALTDARKKRIDVETRRGAMTGMLTTESVENNVGTDSDSLPLVELRKEYLEAKRKLVELSQRYGDKHPEVAATTARIERYKRDLDRQAAGILTFMDVQSHGLGNAEKRYNSELSKLTAEAMQLNKLEVDYKRLVREAHDATEVYNTLIKRFNESGLQAQNEANNIRILDTALAPGRPVEPNLQLVVAFGIALSLLLGLGYAFGFEMMDRTILTQEDVESTLGVPFLGFVPSIRGLDNDKPSPASELFIVKNANSTAAESCRVVRTNILFSSPDRPLKTFVVTSSNPVEGKTMTSINVGIVMAQGGHRTLIIDTDMRRPRVHKIVAVGNDRGISNLILGNAKLEDLVVATDLPNLFVLPCGPLPPNPSELLQSDRFKQVVQMLSEKYDRLIFDSPPLLAVTDAAILSRVVDGTLLVARSGKTHRDALARAKRHLDAVRTTIVGVILNDVDLDRSRSFGYYKYYNYKYYSANETRDGATAG